MGSIADLFDRNIKKIDAKKCGVFFQKCLNCITPPPPLPRALYKGGGEGEWVFEIFEKVEGSDFSHKIVVVGKIGRIILSVWCVYLSVLFIYTSFNVIKQR